MDSNIYHVYTKEVREVLVYFVTEALTCAFVPGTRWIRDAVSGGSRGWDYIRCAREVIPSVASRQMSRVPWHGHCTVHRHDTDHDHAGNGRRI
jgi:hypothetical protein